MSTESPLLWPQLEGRLHPSERDHVKRLLGWGLIDQNAESLEQLESLRSLFYDLRDQQREERPQPAAAGTDGTTPSAAVGRQILVQQIDFFVARLRRASSGGAPPPEAGRPGTSSSRGGARPDTAGSLGSATSAGSGGTAGLAAISAAAQDAVEAAIDSAAPLAATAAPGGAALSLLSSSSGGTLDSATRVLRGALAAEGRALEEEVRRVEALLGALADGGDGEALEDELLRGGMGGPAGFAGCFAATAVSAGDPRLPSHSAAAAAAAAAALPPEPGLGAPLEELRAYKAALQAQWLAVEAAQQQGAGRGEAGAEGVVAEPGGGAYGLDDEWEGRREAGGKAAASAAPAAAGGDGERAGGQRPSRLAARLHGQVVAAADAASSAAASAASRGAGRSPLPPPHRSRDALPLPPPAEEPPPGAQSRLARRLQVHRDLDQRASAAAGAGRGHA